jgi:itaconate CoA-transferase
MLGKADVFVQNLAPGAARRAGFGADALLAFNPRLIVCDITGYGESGPYAEMKAYNLLIQCETGLASITGGPESPGRVGVSVADIGCGMNAHAAILEALYDRERTGKGRAISTSLFDGLADWMAVPLIHREYTGVEPKRIGLNHATIAPYGVYAAADGAQIVIAIQTEIEWASLCQNVLGQAEMAADPRFSSNSLRCAHRGELDAAINSVLSRLDLAALTAALGEHGRSIRPPSAVAACGRRNADRAGADSGAAANLRGRKRRTRSVASGGRALRGDTKGIRRRCREERVTRRIPCEQGKNREVCGIGWFLRKPVLERQQIQSFASKFSVRNRGD